MAISDVMSGLKKKMERYLYGEEEQPQQAPRREENYAPAPDAAFTQQPVPPQYGQPQAGYYPQQGYQPQAAQPAYQQQGYQPQAAQPAYPQQGYQPQAAQPAYQQQGYQPQAAQPAYQQQGYQPQAAQHQPQSQQVPRNGWTSRFGQNKEKVVNIQDYQQPQEEAQPAAEEMRPAAQPVATRVVCARGMMDCRLAITLLRAGDAVLLTMENVKDPAEMRRLVDTLSGACYSLSASITKVSRYGVYLLAPQSMMVYADQLINQMNGAAPRQPRAAAYQPGSAPRSYQQPAEQLQQVPQQPVYHQAPAENGYQQPQNYAYQPQTAYQPQQAPQQGAFTQRVAAPAENGGSFYARPQQQAAPQMPAFASQSANTGYVPDDMEVAE